MADEVRKYTESRSAGLLDWHPTKHEMLISTRFGNSNQVHRVVQPLGARSQITFFNEPVGSATYEPKFGKYFVFGKDTGGNEFSQLYRFDVGDGRCHLAHRWKTLAERRYCLEQCQNRDGVSIHTTQWSRPRYLVDGSS
jgi:hypothetical protein